MREDVRIIKTKKNIEESMISLLETKDFRRLTIKDICQKAMISKSTFYTHYLDKYDLLEKIVTTYSQLVSDEIALRFQTEQPTHIVTNFHNLESILLGNRQAYKTLLKIHEPEADLSAKLEHLFYEHSLAYIKAKEQKLEVPKEFLASIYATYVMQLLVWMLKTGETSKVLPVSELLQSTFDL